MVSIPSRSKLLSTASRRDLALKRYGSGVYLVALTGVPSKPPSRNISPMILSEAPLPYISAVSTRVTPSAMLARKAFPTSLRSYSLPYPHSLVVPHAQAPTPRGATFSSSARAILGSFCRASPLIHSLLRMSILQHSSNVRHELSPLAVPTLERSVVPSEAALPIAVVSATPHANTAPCPNS